jgi:hypothetical protein
LTPNDDRPRISKDQVGQRQNVLTHTLLDSLMADELAAQYDPSQSRHRRWAMRSVLPTVAGTSWVPISCHLSAFSVHPIGRC